MHCSACGAQIVEGSAFCGSCGRVIPGPSASTMLGVEAAASSPVAAEARSVGSRNYAGFWLRVIAAFVDGFLLFVIVFALFGVRRRIFGMPAPLFGPRPGGPLSEPFGFLRGGAVVGAWLYFALMESSSWQGTFGKKALGLYVTDLQGHRITFGRATGRYFAKLISNFTLLIGYLMAGFTAKKQALHDMIAGCLVMKKG
jgi:uncharacterized RDD family membrane protein YckC